MEAAKEAPIDWERLAKVDARARHFGESKRAEIARRGGGDPAEHEAQAARARRALLEEAFAQESALAILYAAPFAAERRRLAAESPPIESIGELPPQAIEVPKVALPDSEAAPAPSAPVDATPAPDEVQRPAQVVQPFPSGPRLVPTYLQRPAEPPAPPVRLAAPPAPAFVAPPLAPPLVPPATTVEIRLARLAGMDPDTTQPPITRSEPTLPFAAGVRGEVPAAVRALAHAGEDGEDDDEEDEGTRDGDETAFLPSRLFTEPATPFEKANEKLSEKKAVEAAETVALDGDAVRAAAAAPEPWISLDEYASFLAEFAMDMTRAGVLRAKYGIAGEDAQRALGAGFAAKFTREPGLRAQFGAALARERARRR